MSPNKPRTKLQELGDALDIAEASDPGLRPRDLHNGRPGFMLWPYRLAPWEALISGNPWLVPQHRAVRAYWRELKKSMLGRVYVEDTLRRCRRKFKLASVLYDDLTIRRDSGYFINELPSLRAILDARAALIESYIIFEQVEASANYIRQIKASKRRAASDAKLKQRNPEAYAMQRAERARRSP